MIFHYALQAEIDHYYLNDLPFPGWVIIGKITRAVYCLDYDQPQLFKKYYNEKRGPNKYISALKLKIKKNSDFDKYPFTHFIYSKSIEFGNVLSWVPKRYAYLIGGRLIGPTFRHELGRHSDNEDSERQIIENVSGLEWV